MGIRTVQHLEQFVHAHACVCTGNMFSLAASWTQGMEMQQPHPSRAARSGLIFSPNTREEKAFEKLRYSTCLKKDFFYPTPDTMIITFHSVSQFCPFSTIFPLGSFHSLHINLLLS